MDADALMMLAPGDEVAVRAEVVTVFGDEIEICLHVKHGARYRTHVPKKLIVGIASAPYRADSFDEMRARGKTAARVA